MGKKPGTQRFALVLLTLVLIAADTAAIQRSREDGDRLERKIEAINRNAAATEPEPKTTPVSESEINSYLAFNIKDKIPRGLANPEINARGNGALTGRVIVDLDEFNRSRAPQGLMDPLAYLSGRLPVTARGILRAADGKGRFQLISAEIAGVALPKPVVQELVSYFSRTAQNPRGLNIDEPFDLPAKIRRIAVNQGEAIVVQ